MKRMAALMPALVLVNFASPALAQTEKIVVPLRMNLDALSFGGVSVDFGKEQGGGRLLTIAEPGTMRKGIAPGGIQILAEKIQEPRDAYVLRIDSDKDGDFSNETPRQLAPNSSTQVEVTRGAGNIRRIRLPYTIKYSHYTNRNNEIEENFLWLSRYRAQGKLKIDSCEALIVVLDLNGDGVFDERDFRMGTTIGLDRNNDGEIRGQDEWLKGRQIIEFCDRQFLVDSLSEDGAVLTLARTSLRSPKIGETVPLFVLTTDGGKDIRSELLKGKLFLLDFWASWCSPCVEKFPKLKEIASEFGNELEVITVNVDEPSKMALARQVIMKYQLQWPHVIAGLGDSDPLWKMFGGMEGNRLSIPLYVLIDKNGTLRYAGHGGDDLSALRAALSAAQGK